MGNEIYFSVSIEFQYFYFFNNNIRFYGTENFWGKGQNVPSIKKKNMKIYIKILLSTHFRNKNWIFESANENDIQYYISIFFFVPTFVRSYRITNQRWRKICNDLCCNSLPTCFQTFIDLNNEEIIIISLRAKWHQHFISNGYFFFKHYLHKKVDLVFYLIHSLWCKLNTWGGNENEREKLKKNLNFQFE